MGTEPEPMAIAWHPYFNLPSGDRTQARVQIPASTVAEVDGYDNVFPTGKLVPVEGTKFDLRSSGGNAAGHATSTTTTGATWSGPKGRSRSGDRSGRALWIKIEGLSPEIKAIQMYAPPMAHFVAIEHQYNLADPFGKEWGKTEKFTGMVTLKPGQATKWHVRLHVFVP